MGDYKQVGENLVRHANGTYYLRAKIRGKVIRESLRLKDLRLAKIKRDDRLAALRAAAAVTAETPIRTMREALDVLRSQMIDRPNIEAKTRAYCEDVLRILTDTLPLEIHARTWTQTEAAVWWRKLAGRYSASVANKVLAAVKKLAGIMIARGARSDDPTRDLKRMREKRPHRALPDTPGMLAVIEHIRNQKKRGSTESALFVCVAIFTGMRVGELTALRWKDIGEDSIIVGQDGQTKGKTFRRIPLCDPLRAELDAVPAESRIGQVFTMKNPRRALHSACAKLGQPDMRVHDLRHWFTTWAIQSGVDIPTVAKWLGHKDGGALLMKTYAHVHDAHSMRAGSLLKLDPAPVVSLRANP